MQGNVGGWSYTHQNEEVSRPFETGARVIKNDDLAKDFYMMCHQASTPEKKHLDLLVGSNPKCRDCFVFIENEEQRNSETMFLSQADGTICKEVDKKKEKEFYEKVQQIVSGDKEIESWITKEDPSIRQLLEKIKDGLGGQDVVDHFITENVEPRLSTVFIGSADTLSAQVILSRMVPSIKIPQVNFEESAEVNENPVIQKEIDEYHHEYAKNQKAFFVAHK